MFALAQFTQLLHKFCACLCDNWALTCLCILIQYPYHFLSFSVSNNAHESVNSFGIWVIWCVYFPAVAEYFCSLKRTSGVVLFMMTNTYKDRKMFSYLTDNDDSFTLDFSILGSIYYHSCQMVIKSRSLSVYLSVCFSCVSRSITLNFTNKKTDT